MPADQRTRWAYLAVFTPIIWASTYYLTTDWLPPGRPWLASLVRTFPTGLILIIGSVRPPRAWWGRIVLLSALFASAFMPLLFVAAYRLPGGVASVINSIGPIIVVLISVPLLGLPVRPLDLVAGLIGVGGVAILVLRADAAMDPIGIVAMVVCVAMMSFGNVLMKRWGVPPGMTTTQFTGWLFLVGGLTLLPATLALEGLPSELSARNVAGYAYLVVFGGITSYALWFWALKHLSATSVTFLGLINPVTAAALGWILLGQALTHAQLFGALLVLVSVLLGQLGNRPRPVPT